MAACVTLSLISKGWLTARLALAASFGFHVATAFGIRRVLRRVSTGPIPDVAAAAWLVNPLTYAIASQSVEVTLYTFVLTQALICHLDMARAIDEGSPLPGVRYGIWLGIVCLSRTEGVLVAALGLCWLTLRLRTRGDRYRVPARALFVLCLVILPWACFTLVEVGTMVPDSGAMKALWTTDLFATWHSRIQNVLDTLGFFGVTGARAALGWQVPVWLLTAIYLAGGAWLARLALDRASRSAASLIRAVAASAGLVVATYAWALSDRQIWWLSLPALSAWLLGSVAVERLAVARPQASLATPLGVLACSWFVALTFSFGRAPLYPWQVDVYRSQPSIESLVPGDRRIGYFNSGIPTYFGSGREVALEGIVSHDALGYWRARRLDRYLVDRDVSYVADEPRAVARGMRFSQSPPSMFELARFPLTGWPTGHRILWRLGPSSDPVR
jgi:hypothetical protein